MINLRRKGNFKRPAETRGKFNIGKTIKKDQKKFLVEMLLGIGKLILSFQEELMEKQKAIIELLSKFPKELVKTITCDR